jgi:hypothetical protein
MSEQLLARAEAVLEEWLHARGEAPTAEALEGFRLLALHRQGARGSPSFNACRETCREIAYHYNLLAASQEKRQYREKMMGMLVEHLELFVRGKMEAAGLGEFCCAARPLRSAETEAPAHG